MIYTSNQNCYLNPALARVLLQSRWTLLSIFLLTFAYPVIAFARSNDSYVSTAKGRGKFTLSASGKSAPLHASSQDHPGVLRVLKQLQADITRVTKEIGRAHV